MLHFAEASRYVNNYNISKDLSLRGVIIQEATTKVITVKEFGISTVKHLISFFYKGDYNEKIPTESGHDEDTVITDANDDECASNDACASDASNSSSNNESRRGRCDGCDQAAKLENEEEK